MSTFKPDAKDYITVEDKGTKRSALKIPVFDQFATSLLGLGELTKASNSTDAIAAIFDLQGFTTFCKQIEPHLSVPRFLNEFLDWLFQDLREEMTSKKYAEGVVLYSPLPFFVKFMGDGILALWDVASAADVTRRNIVVSCSEICRHYKTSFYPMISKKVRGRTSTSSLWSRPRNCIFCWQWERLRWFLY